MGLDRELPDVFDDNFLYFHAPLLTEERSEADTDLACRLLDLKTGTAVLDLACGTGRIANRLAARGCVVTGLDASEHYLDIARHVASQTGLVVEYVCGDMRQLPWSQPSFDAVVCAWTSFGYFADDDNKRVLGEIRRVLRPGGLALIDVLHRSGAMSHCRYSVMELGDDFMIDQREFDVTTERWTTYRVTLRSGEIRRMHFFIRAFTLIELSAWLREAGFRDVRGFGGDGRELTASDSTLLVVVQ